MPRMVEKEVVVEFLHVEKPGELWVDWGNELGEGKQKVWEVIGKREGIMAYIFNTGETEHYQVFTPLVLRLRSDLSPSQTGKKVRPSPPYDRLGVKEQALA
jgi:hypothetical protein